MPNAVKAAASYAEVEEALKAFLARHPEVSHDTQVSKGSRGDEILSGAIATMTYEGEGSLFDTMNYGTGNQEADRAVVADLSKALDDLGCYYEQGHDWSLGVYPKEESGEEKAERELLQKMAAALGVDEEDLTVDSTESTDEGPVVTVSHGNKTYLVGDDMALHALALARFKDQVDEDPAGMIGEGWMGWLDRQAVREEAETVAEEIAEGNADDLKDSEKREWLEKADLLPAPENPEEDADPSDEQVEKAFAEHWSEWVEEAAKAMVGEDPFAFLEEMSGGEEEFKKHAIKDGLLAFDRMADDIVSNDGFESVLGGTLQENGGLSYLEM